MPSCFQVNQLGRSQGQMMHWKQRAQFWGCARWVPQQLPAHLPSEPACCVQSCQPSLAVQEPSCMCQMPAQVPDVLRHTGPCKLWMPSSWGLPWDQAQKMPDVARARYKLGQAWFGGSFLVHLFQLLCVHTSLYHKDSHISLFCWNNICCFSLPSTQTGTVTDPARKQSLYLFLHLYLHKLICVNSKKYTIPQK